MISLAGFVVWAIGGAVLSLDVLSQLAPISRTPEDAESDTQRPPPYSDASTSTVRPKRSAFAARRLNASTFLIVETDDVFDEQPFIYVKIVRAANTIVLLDTGCGGRSKVPVEISSLREFLEIVPVDENHRRPLNIGGRMGYVVVLSHCHYDHILGVEPFARDSPILESSHSPSFVSPAHLPAHSQCARLNVPTPAFHPTLVPHNTTLCTPSGAPLGLTLLHTPGHTPDELALWDAEQETLYVGDTLYERAPIIFPAEGDIPTWLESVRALRALVQSSAAPGEVRICCGHETAGKLALDVLEATEMFMMDVLEGREKEKREWRRGTWYVEYWQAGGRFGLVCPERLVLEARERLGIDV